MSNLINAYVMLAIIQASLVFQEDITMPYQH